MSEQLTREEFAALPPAARLKAYADGTAGNLAGHTPAPTLGDSAPVLTRDEFAALTPQDRLTAHAEGRITDLLKRDAS